MFDFSYSEKYNKGIHTLVLEQGNIRLCWLVQLYEKYGFAKEAQQEDIILMRKEL